MPIQVTTDLPSVSIDSLDNGVEDEVTVNWSDVINYGSYEVDYRETSSSTWLDGATLDETTSSATITGLEDGEQYEFRMRTTTEHVTTDWSTSESIVTQFPGASDLLAFSESTTERYLSWADNSDNEDGFKVLRRAVGDANWTEIADVAPDTTSYVDAESLVFDEQYEYKIRAYTDDTSADSSLEPTVALADTQVALDWRESDFSTLTPDGYRIYKSADDGASYTQIADVGASTTSYTTDDLTPNSAHKGSWTFKVEAYTSDGATESLTFTGATRTLSLTGPYTLGVRLGGELGWVTGDICKSVLATLQPTTISQWEFETGYLPELEAWTFGEIFLYGERNDGTFALIVRGELDQALSTDSSNRTTARGRDVFAKLTTGSTAKQYSATPTHIAIRDYWDSETPFDATVDDPNPETVVSGQTVQSATTTSDWESVTTLADTIPATVQNGRLEAQQTCFVSEAETPDRENEPALIQSDGALSGNQAYGISNSSSYLEWDFTPQYRIPADNVVVAVRWPGSDTDILEFKFVLNNDTIAYHNGGADIDNGPGWMHLPDAFKGDGYTGGDLQAGTTYTLKFEATGSTGTNTHADVVSVYDSRHSYFFDNDNGGNGGYLDGPQLYPNALDVTLDVVEKNYNFESADLVSTWKDSDVSSGQAVRLSNDNGSTYPVAAANSSSVSGSFSDNDTYGTLLRVQFALSRYGSRTSATPQKGFKGQGVDSFSVDATGNDLSVIDDQSFKQSDYRNLKRLHEFGGYEWSGDYKEQALTVHSFPRGSVLKNASWTRLDDSRDYEVTGYFNAIEVRGEGWTPDSPTPSAYYQHDDEVSRLAALDAGRNGSGVVEANPYTDPELSSEGDCKSKARTLVSQGVGEDELAGTVDIVSKALAPGYDYEIPAWDNQRATAERIVFSESRGAARGTIHFSDDAGLVGPLADLTTEVEKTK
jgi:hypothetical protein